MDATTAAYRGTFMSVMTRCFHERHHIICFKSDLPLVEAFGRKTDVVFILKVHAPIICLSDVAADT